MARFGEGQVEKMDGWCDRLWQTWEPDRGARIKVKVLENLPVVVEARGILGAVQARALTAEDPAWPRLEGLGG